MEKTDIELVLEAYGRLPRKDILPLHPTMEHMVAAKDEILDILLRSCVDKVVRYAVLGMVQAELHAREASHQQQCDMHSPFWEKERLAKPAALEEIIAFIEPPQEMGAEIREAFQKWAADLTSGALKHIDALIERDKGTELEGRWRELRERSCGEMNK